MLAQSVPGRRAVLPELAQRAALPAQPRRSSPARREGTEASVERLQREAGNRAVVQLLAANGLIAQRAPDDQAKPADAKPGDAKGPGAGAAPDKGALRKAWAEAGLVAGGPLYDLINSDLSVESLVGMALPELVGLANEGAAAGFDKGTEAAGTKGEMKPVGLDKKEAGQVTEALTGWAQKAADTWLKSADGKKLLAKAQAFVNEHPKGAYWVVVSTLALAIAGAVTAYFTGMIDPKEIKKAFEVKGLKIDAAVDLGKFQERILQSARLALSGKAGPGAAALEGSAKTVTDKKESGYELGVTGSYTLGDPKKGDSAKLSGGYAYNTLKDESSANLGASFKFKPVTIDTTWKFAGDGSGILDTQLVGKLSSDLTLGAGASGGAYGPAAASDKSPFTYKLSLTSTKDKDSDKVTMDITPATRTVTLGTEQARAIWGGTLTTTTSQGAGDSVGMSFTRNALKADLKYSVDKAGKESLDAGASGKGEGVEAAFAAKFGLSTGQLDKLTVHLGFTTPDETLKFLHDLSVDVSSGKVEAKATETIKVRLKQIAVEVEASVTEKGGKEAGAGVRSEVGWKLPSGLILGAGAAATSTPGKDNAPVPWLVGPQVSVSHEALPIRLIGGVNVPVGPGSENMPPVFGLSVAPNFEFWSPKKK